MLAPTNDLCVQLYKELSHNQIIAVSPSSPVEAFDVDADDFPNTYYIYKVTYYAKQAISVRALEYLLKPYNEEELISAVEEAMQHASGFVSKTAGKAEKKDTPSPVREEGIENVRLALIREDIRAYIEKNYRQDISMQSTAQSMGYSEAYFCKLFKQCFRVNFSAYLNEYRIHKAQAMMGDPRINIKDIGIACGYSDSNYFARVFKRITGQTPSDYRLAAAERAIRR